MHLTPNNIAAIAEVADQILGKDHVITKAIRSLLIEPESRAKVWSMIEGLPGDQRRILAAMIAERMDTSPLNDTLH